MAGGKITVQTDCLVGVFRSQLHPLRIGTERVFVSVGVAQGRIACRRLRIEYNCPLEELNGLIDTAIAVGVVQIFLGTRIECVGIVVHRRFSRASLSKWLRFFLPPPAGNSSDEEEHE